MARPERLPSWAAVVVLAVLAAVVLFALRAGGHGPLAPTIPPKPAEWWLAAEPAPGDDVLELVVNEQDCASGRSADGRIVADVTYRTDVIELDVRVRPLGGDQTCQGNPDTPYELELSQPIADRAVTAAP